MIRSFELENFGPIEALSEDSIGQVNVFIGPNAAGKTFLLKALYTFIRTTEEFGLGNDPRRFEKILADKLYWTFQVDKLGELITKGSNGRLRLSMETDQGSGTYSFGTQTINTITTFENNFKKRANRSIFVPAKEVFTLIHVIIQSREQHKAFGFDDTHLDLAKALSFPMRKGKNSEGSEHARERIEQLVGGKMIFDGQSGDWILKNGRFSYPINIASDGLKKISMFEILLGNRYLTPGSVVFIDEPEAALHPGALTRFIEIIILLAMDGMQVFIATHSYFTIKKFLLLARKYQNPISILSFTDESIERYNLLDGMPENSIIQESIDLYEEEVRLSFDEGPESRARSLPSAAQRKPRRIISESSGISNTSS